MSGPARRAGTPDTEVATCSVARACAALERHRDRLRDTGLRQLFEDRPDRHRRFSREAAGLHIDFSRELLDAPALTGLLRLIDAAEVESRRDAMLAGAPVNETERRPALHVLLRERPGDREDAPTGGLLASSLRQRERFLDFAEAVRRGAVGPVDGGRFEHVVNLGIGGSELGPLLASQALAPFHDGPGLTFLSNVDGAHVADGLRRLDPRRALVIVSSKTFTTGETLANADTVRRWLQAAPGAALRRQLAAATAHPERAAAFGIDRDRIFPYAGWVGGRYSLCSSAGLALAIAIGRGRFEELLDGARSMDRHFAAAPPERNLPMLLALIGIWRRNLLHCPAVAMIPYDHRLGRFPAYVQQLEMESNGKSARLDGSPSAGDTAPILWGEPGTNAQHSFFQLLHQGTTVVPVDFLLAAADIGGSPGHHDHLAANALAQAAALAFGETDSARRKRLRTAGTADRDIDRLAPHQRFAGNRPSTLTLYKQLDPATLGALIALHEHRVFVQACIWGVNPFDQWGVELGKSLAARILPALRDPAQASGLDPATRGALQTLEGLRRQA